MSIKFKLVGLIALCLSTFSMAASDAHLKGRFGPVFDWPVMPIHMILNPDGRILAYGTTPTGLQRATLHYLIWDPALGNGLDAFQLLPNTTGTDIFCGGQVLLPDTGESLLIGGDATVNKKRNYGNADVVIYDWQTDSLTKQDKSMIAKRWYATGVTLPTGQVLALGGRDSVAYAGTATIPATENIYAPIPELRAYNGAWRNLTTAASDFAYGAANNSFYYPKAWVAPKGGVFIVAPSGRMFNLKTTGTGVLNEFSTRVGVESGPFYSAIMYEPGKILTIRQNSKAFSIDINTTGEPIVTASGDVSADRKYGTMTVLANGEVFFNGGSSTGNDLAGAVYTSEIWNPDSQVWRPAASAAEARLYHSASIMLMDGSVLTGGGGAPGPLTQLNGEIYYPPYLFKKNGSGEFAYRPKIISAPDTIGWNQEFSIQASDKIDRVTLVRFGATTHTYNNETRFFELPVQVAGNVVDVKSPASSNIAPPGYYMLFVWGVPGTPSVAKVIKVE